MSGLSQKYSNRKSIVQRSVLISVIIPTYNVAAFIGETLGSVCGQQGVDALEILVIDDGSIDDTTAQVEHRAKFDPRIRLARNAGRKGAAGARNYGLTLARGEWVAFIDGDDLWEPDNLALKLAAAQQFPEAELISSDFYNENRFNKTVPRADWPKTRQSLLPVWRKNLPPDNGSAAPCRISDLPIKFICDEMLGHTGTFLTRRSLLSAAGGFDETLEVGEDVDLWIRLAIRLPFMVYLPQPLLYYRYRPGSLTNQDYPAAAFFASVYFRRMLAMPEFAPYRSEIRQRLARSALAKTYYFRRQGMRGEAIRSAADSLRFDWGRLESWKNLAAALVFR